MSKNHLVASKGKVSAEIFAHAIAKLQAARPAKKDPTVQEAATSTAVGTEHNNYGQRPKRKELDKTYDKPATKRSMDTRNSKQRRADADARLNGGA